nr:glycosyltransferase family 1 protein [Oscillochloris trichoides]
MRLNIKPVEDVLLTPYIIMVVKANGDLNEEEMNQFLKRWTGCSQDKSQDWSNIAEKNILLFKREKGGIPFPADQVYEGRTRWATMYKAGQGIYEVSLGLCVSCFKVQPDHIQVAKETKDAVLKTVRAARKWKLPSGFSYHTEIMLNRQQSRIILAKPPSLLKSFFDQNVLQSLIPFVATALGAVISVIQPFTVQTLIQGFPQKVAPLGFSVLIGYFFLAIINWVSVRTKVSWTVDEGA